MGAFATEDIAAGTLIRRSPTDSGNFLRMRSYEELVAFCALGDADCTDAERSALKEYVTGRPHGSPSLRTNTWTARRSSRA